MTRRTSQAIRKGGIWGPILILTLTPWIGSPRGQTVKPDLKTRHIERTRQTLAAHLRSDGLQPEALELERIGEAAVFPAHSKHHRRKGRSGRGPATITGRVKDSTGAVIPGAAVTAAAPNARPISVETNQKGDFRIDGIPPGRVTVVVLLAGFKRAAYFLELEPGDLRHLSPRLEIGPLSEAIILHEDDLDPKLPSAIVPWGVQISSSEFRPYLVFDGGLFQGPVFLTAHSPTAQLPLDRWEYDQAQVQLRTFYDDLLDRSAGTHRLLPYFSEEAVEYWRNLARTARSRGQVDPLLPPVELSPSGQREWLALWLEHSVYEAWRRFEALPEPEPPRGEPSYWEVRNHMERQIEELRLELENLGAFDEPHATVTAPYLRRLLGEGLLAKQLVHLGTGTSLSPVYKIRVLPYLMLYFAPREGRLQIVLLLVDD